MRLHLLYIKHTLLYWKATITLWILMRIFRLAGWWRGLPSLSAYSDEQIIAGLRKLKERK